jgi:hypothetical protein
VIDAPLDVFQNNRRFEHQRRCRHGRCGGLKDRHHAQRADRNQRGALEWSQEGTGNSGWNIVQGARRAKYWHDC